MCVCVCVCVCSVYTQEPKHDLMLPPDLGITLSVLDMDRYAVPQEKPALHPDDLKLLGVSAVCVCVCVTLHRCACWSLPFSIMSTRSLCVCVCVCRSRHTWDIFH